MSELGWLIAFLLWGLRVLYILKIGVKFFISNPFHFFLNALSWPIIDLTTLVKKE